MVNAANILNLLPNTMQAAKSQEPAVPKKYTSSSSNSGKSFRQTLEETAAPKKDLESAAENNVQQNGADAPLPAQVPTAAAELQTPTAPSSQSADGVMGLLANASTVTEGVLMQQTVLPQNAAAMQEVSQGTAQLVQNGTTPQTETAPQSPVQPMLTESQTPVQVQPEAMEATVKPEATVQNTELNGELNGDEQNMGTKKSDLGQSVNGEEAQAQNAKSSGTEVKAIDQKGQSFETQKEPPKEEAQTTLSGSELPKTKTDMEGNVMTVKVSDGQTVADPQKFTADVGEKILFKAADGKQEFDIQLSPAELGKINIKLIFENGKATMLVHCSNPQTQQALMANEEQLRHILESGTGRQTEVVAREDASSSMQQQSDQRGENQARDEQQERLNQSYKPDRSEVISFVERFRLGILETEKAM